MGTFGNSDGVARVFSSWNWGGPSQGIRSTSFVFLVISALGAYLSVKRRLIFSPACFTLPRLFRHANFSPVAERGENEIRRWSCSGLKGRPIFTCSPPLGRLLGTREKATTKQQKITKAARRTNVSFLLFSKLTNNTSFAVVSLLMYWFLDTERFLPAVPV